MFNFTKIPVMLTCPRCGQCIAIAAPGPRYELRTCCPYCHHEIMVEVGAPQVGPSEFKEE